MYGGLEIDRAETSAITIDYIAEREGQMLSAALRKRLLPHQSLQPENHYQVKITLNFGDKLQSSLHTQDTPSWWQIECKADMIVTLDGKGIRLLPRTDLEKKLGVQDSFEGRRIVFRKLFYESASIVTGFSPAAFDIAKTQAREQIVEQLSEEIYRELLWFMYEDQRLEEGRPEAL